MSTVLLIRFDLRIEDGGEEDMPVGIVELFVDSPQLSEVVPASILIGGSNPVVLLILKNIAEAILVVVSEQL